MKFKITGRSNSEDYTIGGFYITKDRSETGILVRVNHQQVSLIDLKTANRYFTVENDKAANALVVYGFTLLDKTPQVEIFV